MSADEAELKRLMMAGQSGDGSAYRLLLDRLSRRLRSYYRSKLNSAGRSGADTEDLVQDVLLAIHAHRHTYNPGELFTPWVHAIARYKLIDYLRRRNTGFANIPLDDFVIDASSQDDRAAAESSYDLQTLLARLPDRMQRVIRFVKIEGLSVAEAAKRSDMSESAVKINIHRGLRKLAALIARDEKS